MLLFAVLRAEIRVYYVQISKSHFKTLSSEIQGVVDRDVGLARTIMSAEKCHPLQIAKFLSII